MTRASSLILVLALLVACERPRSPEETRQLTGKALSGALAYPRSSMVTASAGREAAELVMTSPDSVKVVARWFVESLRLNHWDVQRTITDRSGTVTIYAERDKRPLWLTLRPNSGGPGTTYTMIGVIPMDSTAAGKDSTHR